MKFRLLISIPALLLASCAAFLSGERSERGIEENLSRRTVGAIITDEAIEDRIRINLDAQEPALNEANVSVMAHNGVVLLAGQVPSPELKQRAVEIASEASSRVRRIHDELEITGNIGLLVRGNDTLISARVRLALSADDSVGDAAYRVTTQNGTVYLMGVVDRGDGDRAATLASDVSGVTRVVKVFEYLN